MPHSKPIRISHAEWLAEAERRYGRQLRAIRFRCPSCGFLQSGEDFLALPMEVDQVLRVFGYSCIGRWTSGPPVAEAFTGGPGPCNYTSGGLIGIAPVHVLMDDGTERPTFDFADEPLCGGRPDMTRVPPMRSQDELQRAHDLLVGILLGEIPIVVDERERPLMTAATDVLCWALRHEHNRNFEFNLQEFERALRECGGELRAVEWEEDWPCQL